MTTEESAPSSPSSPKAVHHKQHDVYSESLPIPSIQRFFKRGLAEVIHHDDSESEVESSSDEEGQEQQRQKVEEEKRKLEKGSEKKSEKKLKKGKTRIVEDPITNTSVAIHDVGKKEYGKAMQDAGDTHHDGQTNGRASTSSLDRKSSKSSRRGKASQEESRQNGHSSHHHETSSNNVLSLPFPPEISLPVQPWNVHWLVLPFFGAWSVLTVTRLLHPIFSVLSMAWLGWWVFQRIVAGVEDNRWDRERQRGKAAQKGYYNSEEQTKEEKYGSARPMDGFSEGAEWLNALVESLWGVLNSDLFNSLGSMLEDVLQASTHGQAFIQAVKVEDIGQGSTPIRLTGLRVLGDKEAYELRQQAQKEMKDRQAREAKVGLPLATKDKGGVPSLADEERVSKSRKAGKPDDHIDAEGSFINVELNFVYRARPTSASVASKTRNMHLLIKFWVGARKWYTVPLPVWVEVKGFVGKVRARIQLTPDPPFIKNVTFAFMGLPRTQVSVIPLRINTQNIPFLSGFIQKSIDAAVGEYCAPSSLTIDVGEALMGDNIKREVNAMGVVIVVIHRAFDLEKQDVRGSSDPYCTVSLKKNGKIQYCTRVALDDLSPRWEERCFLIVTPEAVRVKEKVSISLWDSDRLSADDVLGQAEVDLQALVRRPGRLFRRTDTLVGLTREMKKQGTVQWSVGYFAKAPNVRRLVDEESRQKEKEDIKRFKSQDPDAINVEEADVEKDMHAMDDEDEAGELHLPEDDARQTRHTEQAVSFEPPSKAMPSGILALQVHQIESLEVIDTHSHTMGRRSADTAQKVDTVDDQQEQSRSPSSYVTIVLNDETIFRSRVKALNSSPFFNAGTERLITDWERTLVMFVVWDSRLREDDAILGVVPLKLSDVFTKTSQVTQYFPLAGGVGQGRIRVSLLFRPLQDTIKRKEKLGWNIGTMRILSSFTATDFDPSFSSMALRLVSLRCSAQAGKVQVSSRRCSHSDKDHSSSIEWQLKKNELPLKIPIRRRYAAPFVIEFRGLSALGKRKTIAMCILWMQDLSDDDVVEHKLPIWQAYHGQDFHRLVQNYHDYRREKEAEDLGVHRVGYMHVSMQFKSGAGPAHLREGKKNADIKEVMDAWTCCTSAGLRNVRGDFVEPTMDDEDDHQSQVFVMAPDAGKGNCDGIDDENDDDDSDDSDEGERKDEEEAERREREVKRRSPDADEDDEQDEDEHGILDKFKKWTEERKELHRQHKGIKQYKVARTATWLGKGVREGTHRAAHSLGLQDKRGGQVESEL